MTDPTIETEPTGTYFNYHAPIPVVIHLEDIARSLSMTCRFGGHVKRFYSVAEHAVRVSELLDAPLALAGLHHDSHEAYLGDIPTPLKNIIGPKADILAHEIDAAISEKFGIQQWDLCHPIVKVMDRYMLRLEAGQLKSSRGTGLHWGSSVRVRNDSVYLGWSPEIAEAKFLRRHRDLVSQ